MITKVRHKSTGDIYLVKDLNSNGGHLSLRPVHHPDHKKEGFRDGMDRREWINKEYDVVVQMATDTPVLPIKFSDLRPGGTLYEPKTNRKLLLL